MFVMVTKKISMSTSVARSNPNLLIQKNRHHIFANMVPILWLGMRDGNITFEDSLDFDISEIESVYEDDVENQ